MYDYWGECIAEAFEDAGITATKEQIDTVTSWVEGAHDNYGMATGSEFIPNPLESEIKQLNAAHEREIKEYEKRDFIYRKSVARRRNCSPGDVYIDGDDVLYSR